MSGTKLCITCVFLLHNMLFLYHFRCAHIYSAHITVEAKCPADTAANQGRAVRDMKRGLDHPEGGNISR